MRGHETIKDENVRYFEQQLYAEFCTLSETVSRDRCFLFNLDHITIFACQFRYENKFISN